MDEKGYVKVNDRLETNVSGIYAIGDIKPGPAFTHISYDDFRIIQANLLQIGNARIDGRLVRKSSYEIDRKSTRLNSSHRCISYAVFCLKKKKKIKYQI